MGAHQQEENTNNQVDRDEDIISDNENQDMNKIILNNDEGEEEEEEEEDNNQNILDEANNASLQKHMWIQLPRRQQQQLKHLNTRPRIMIKWKALHQP